jgi:hypothetical protein
LQGVSAVGVPLLLVYLVFGVAPGRGITGAITEACVVGAALVRTIRRRSHRRREQAAALEARERRLEDLRRRNPAARAPVLERAQMAVLEVFAREG